MNEQEWLTCTDPQPMLEFLRGRTSERKERLVAVAAAYLVWDQMPAALLREAVQFAERRADGLVSLEQLDAFRQRFLAYLHDAPDETKRIYESRVNRQLLWLVIATNPHVEWSGLRGIIWRGGIRVVSHEHFVPLIKDIFGNPFRPVALDPSWLAWNGGTVVKLAQAVYDERAFDRLPLLADALEDAGCTDEMILSHCRGPGQHVRGCWVVDLLLGKK